MKWYNLKQNKCPQCDKEFSNFEGTYIKCGCGFIISLKRFNEIVSDQVNRTVSRFKNITGESENQEELSNL